jgi:hypothetical protein
MLKMHSSLLALVAVLAAAPASANVITDWDATGVALIQGNAPAPPPRVGGATGGMRTIALMHLAMFEAVNSIEPRYQPFYGGPNPKVDASQDAAAASAAATVLAKLDPESAAKVKDALEKSLAAIPNGDGKDRGIKIGEGNPSESSNSAPTTATTRRTRFAPSPGPASTQRPC